MSIGILELYKEYLELLIEKKRKGEKLDIVESRFIKALEEFDDWFVKYGVKEYL